MKLDTIELLHKKGGNSMKKRAHNFIDLSGRKFNMLYVIEPVEYKDGIKWKCRCDCGNVSFVQPAKLKEGSTKSCGCLNQSRTKTRALKHGHSKTKLYAVRNTMIQRCENENSVAFVYYGAKGIRICASWRYSYKSFYEWAMANGYKEGLQIDRIDNDGNYEPDNCQWITLSENLAKEAKIDKSKRLEIINLYSNTNEKVKDISTMYNVDQSRIYQILKEEEVVSRKAVMQLQKKANKA